MDPYLPGASKQELEQTSAPEAMGAHLSTCPILPSLHSTCKIIPVKSGSISLHSMACYADRKANAVRARNCPPGSCTHVYFLDHILPGIRVLLLAVSWVVLEYSRKADLSSPEAEDTFLSWGPAPAQYASLNLLAFLSQEVICIPRMQDHTSSQVQQTSKQPLSCFNCTMQVIRDFSSWA